MRVTLADASLARRAGQFVWLELNFDSPKNEAFITGREVAWTPALFIVDPADERATASHFGGLSLEGLDEFLSRGALRVARGHGPSDSALARGDAAMGKGDLGAGVAAYREALGQSAVGAADRPRIVEGLVAALQAQRAQQPCAELAAAEAPRLSPSPELASIVRVGLGCANTGASEPWAVGARGRLEPLAAEDAVLSAATRDDRFALFQALTEAALGRGDPSGAARWGERWLREIDAVKPKSDDERNGLDVARVDAVMLLDTPARALPALEASVQAMPGDYSAAERLARCALSAKRPSEAIAAADRGLAHAPNPAARAELLLTKGKALGERGDERDARDVLRHAKEAAQQITVRRMRELYLTRIAEAQARWK